MKTKFRRAPLIPHRITIDLESALVEDFKALASNRRVSVNLLIQEAIIKFYESEVNNDKSPNPSPDRRR